MRLIGACLFFIIICAASLRGEQRATQAAGGSPSPGARDPVAAPFDPARYRLRETLRLNGPRLETPSVSYSELARGRNLAPAAGARASTEKKRIAIAMLASAILPGAGQLYVWHGTRRTAHLLRAPALLALDAFFWHGYRSNYTRGKELKAQYEAFCDAHWSEERFLRQHPFCDGIGGCDDWRQYNEEGSNHRYFFIYIPKELDREEYYENCGKYDAFAFGWDDWDGDYDNFNPWTPNRTTYWQMRFDSDHHLVRGDQFVMLLIVNRVVSMLDAGLLAHRAARGAYDASGWALDLRPGLIASRVGVSYRF